jgi:hypothetical protein
LAPAPAALDATDTVTVPWSGRSPGTKHLGAITYHDVTASSGYRDNWVDQTVIRVDTD